MLKLTVDRKALIAEMNSDLQKALARAKTHNIRGLSTSQAVVHHFQAISGEFRAGSSEHGFLREYEPRITNADAVTVE